MAQRVTTRWLSVAMIRAAANDALVTKSKKAANSDNKKNKQAIAALTRIGMIIL
jgi:hypothetical protein